MSTPPPSRATTRLPAEERREQIIAAATRAFARGGYAGTSTDVIAREAGVSQPYVVRMFGTKLDLFLEVFRQACARIDSGFRAVIEDGVFDPTSEEDKARLADVYTDLLRDPDFLHVLMHGFAAGETPEIGAVGRAGMSRIYATLKRTGWSDEQVRDFTAYGMLLNVLLSMRAFDAGNSVGPLADLLASCVPDSIDVAEFDRSVP